MDRRYEQLRLEDYLQDLSADRPLDTHLKRCDDLFVDPETGERITAAADESFWLQASFNPPPALPQGESSRTRIRSRSEVSVSIRPLRCRRGNREANRRAAGYDSSFNPPPALPQGESGSSNVCSVSHGMFQSAPCVAAGGILTATASFSIDKVSIRPLRCRRGNRPDSLLTCARMLFQSAPCVAAGGIRWRLS